jgi:hypothetical protein
MIGVHDTSTAGALGDLSRFRHEFYRCLTARADALFELTDAALCAERPVTSLVELSLTAEHRRSHGTLYASLNQGRIDIDRFRNVVASQQLPRCDDGRIVLAVDIRTVVQTLITAGHWREGDPEIWILGDSGYDGPRPAFLLADLPVHLLVRLRSDRVMVFPAPPRRPGTPGRSARHGARFTFKDPQTWTRPAHITTTATTRYGATQARSWDRLHPQLTRTGAWADHKGLIPIMEGTVIRLQVDRLPGTGTPKTPKPLWLWFSTTATTAGQVDRLWQMFLRRFDLEHTFRFLKQTMGWTKPRIRTPEAADRSVRRISSVVSSVCRGPIPGQRRPVARMTRNWPPPASMSAVTGSPGTSRENRSTSQSAASWASCLVGQRATISRPPLRSSLPATVISSAGSTTCRRSGQAMTTLTAPLRVLHPRCASRSATLAFRSAVRLSTLGPRGSFTDMSGSTGSSHTQHRQPSRSATSSRRLTRAN